MADETPAAESTTIPPFLPLSEDKMVSRILQPGIEQANGALRTVLFGEREPPYPWTVKSILVEVERDGRRYEIYFVGERWARAKPEDRKPTREMVQTLRKTYDSLDEEGKKSADAIFEAIGGAPLSELLKESTEAIDAAQAAPEAGE